MFALFPELFIFYTFFSQFILRITLAGFLAYALYIRLKKRKKYPEGLSFLVIKALVVISMVLGYLTQLGALLSMLMSMFFIWRPKTEGVIFKRRVHILLLVISFLILIGGAGPFLAVDIQL